MSGRLSASQSRSIWAAVRQLDANREGEGTALVRAEVTRLTGQESTTRLTEEQARQVLRALRRALPAEAPQPREPWGPRGPGPREAGTITPRQQEVLGLLFEQAGLDTPRRVAFSKRQCGAPWPQTAADADKIMEPLKAMILRNTPWQRAYERAQALVGRAGLDAWQVGFVADLCVQFETATKPDQVLTPHKLLKLVEAEAAVASHRRSA